MATLRLKNESRAALKVGGTRIAPASEADVADRDLKTPDFAGALRAGSVSVVAVPNPAEDQIRLAREVLPGVLTASIQHLAASRSRFEQSQAALFRLRDAYNKGRAEAEARLTAAKDAAPGWKGVRDAVQHFLLDTKSESEGLKAARARLSRAEDRIEKLVNEDLDETDRTREAWFADRATAEKEREAAQAEVRKLEEQAETADPTIRQIDVLEEAAEAVAAFDKDSAIGKEIPALER